MFYASLGFLKNKLIVISIIVTIYQEKESVRILLDEISSTLNAKKLDYEIICVDDGSAIEISQYLNEEIKNRRNTMLVCLARNYGQTAAIEAGLAYARGDVIITIDGDFQNDPVDIPRIVSKLNEGYDMVVGWRRHRKDSFLIRKIPSYLGNKLISKVTKVNLHDYGCGLKGFRRTILQGIQLWGEMHRMLPIYVAMNGAKIAEIEVTHHHRKYGRSKYSIFRGFNLIVDLIAAKFVYRFATRSHYLFGIAGIIFLMLSIPMAIVTSIFKVEKGLLMTVLFPIFGVQFLLVGIFSEILMRIYYLLQHKPMYVIKEIVRGEMGTG